MGPYQEFDGRQRWNIQRPLFASWQDRFEIAAASIRTLVSRATGIANYTGSRVHRFPEFLRLLLCELDTIKQFNDLLAACASLAPNFRHSLAMPLHFRRFSALDNAVQHGLAV